MATRDLTYLIDFNVEGAEDLSTAATNMETLADATEGVNETATIDLELPDTSEIEDVGTAIGDLGADGGPVDNANAKVGGLGGAFKDMVGAMSLVQIGSGVLDFALGKIAERQEEIARIDAFNTDQITAFADAIRLAGDDVDNLVDSLSGTERVTFIDPLAGKIHDITGDLAAAGVSAEQYFAAIEGGQSGIDALTESLDASGVSEDTVTRIRQGAVVTLENYSDAAVQAADSNSVFDESQASANQALQDLLNQQDPMRSFTSEWDLLKESMSDGSIDTEAAADALNTLADGLSLTTDQVLELAQADLNEAAEGALAFADALNSIEFDSTDLQGATNAFAAYTDELFAAANAAESRESAFDALAASAEDQALTFNMATEAGRAQSDALEGVARVIDGELATAYDNANGSQEQFVATATQIGNETLARLQTELGLSAAQVDTLRNVLGLTEGDYEARFALAGAEEARLQLDLLSGAIEGLPDDLEVIVTQQILAGDFVAARDTVATYYAENPVPVPTSVDSAGAEEGLAAAVADPPVATIPAEADTIQAAADLLSAASEPRQALIVAVANNQAASAALETLTNAQRTAFIDVATGSISLPTASGLASRIGTIRVPIQAYWNTRVEGNRPI